MTSFFITTTARDTPWYPWAHSNYIRVIKSAEISNGSGYTLADHPRDANIILFVEPGRKFQSDIMVSPLFKAYKENSMVVDFFDNPHCLLPGLYVGLRREQICGERFQGGFYIRVADNPLFQEFEYYPIKPDVLFSFIGKVSNYPKARQEILRLQHMRAIIKDQSSNQSDKDFDYVKILFRSKFVLAPRGLGSSSWRLYEAMRAGRVPVIISDAWVPPKGLEWNQFSVQIPENSINKIPTILESYEPKSEEMGKRARMEWERCFSYSGSFPWIAQRLIEIANVSVGVSPPKSFSVWREALKISQGFLFFREQVAVRLLGK